MQPNIQGALHYLRSGRVEGEATSSRAIEKASQRKQCLAESWEWSGVSSAQMESRGRQTEGGSGVNKGMISYISYLCPCSFFGLNCPSLTNSLPFKMNLDVMSRDFLPHCWGAIVSPSSGPLTGLLAWHLSHYTSHNVPVSSLLDCVYLKGTKHILFIFVSPELSMMPCVFGFSQLICICLKCIYALCRFSRPPDCQGSSYTL